MNRTNENLLGLENDEVLDLRGHWLYVRKCLNQIEASGIVLPEKSVDQCRWFEILAIGKDIGEPRELPPHEFEWATRHDWAIGDIVSVVDQDWNFIKHSPWSEHEFFVDESVVTLQWEGGDKYLPLGHRVLVRPEQSWREMGGDLLEMPDNAERLPTEGVVTALGTGIYTDGGVLVPNHVERGSKVVLPHTDDFQEVRINDVAHLIVPVEEIDGVFNND